jgi:2-iminobutanoate/2-iminopropanoate deaminase
MSLPPLPRAAARAYRCRARLSFLRGRTIMEKRRSIEVPGVQHKNPIPSAAKRGPFLTTGAISGTDPKTGEVPADLERQCALMFENVRQILAAAGGSPEDILKMTVWMADRGQRETLNRHWTRMFPDPHSRPSRHTMTSRDLAPPIEIQCDILAVLEEPSR